MGSGIALLIFLTFSLAVGVASTALGAWWFEPGHRVARRLRLGLAGPPDVMTTVPIRGQGAALAIHERKLAVVRGPGDLGLVYDLHEMVGAELIFDGQVAARTFRGESRRPLDQINPDVSQVMLRLVFDDPHDPEFEFELYRPADAAQRNGQGPAAAVATARRWFARLEALLRQPMNERQ